jgi:polyketide synthase Type III
MDVPMTISLTRPAAPVEPATGPARTCAVLTGVGTAVTSQSYTQQELLDLLHIDDPKVQSVFLNSAIDRRHLTLPAPGLDGVRYPEAQGELLAKHRRLAVGMGVRALAQALADAGADPSDVEYLCCVTTTGFLTPGLSALLIKEMDLNPGCHRVDVVGMGCNAGLNALNGTAAWAAQNPGRLAVMVCAEACSAAYVLDGTMRTAVVNSLFGDGAAAVALVAGRRPDGTAPAGPRVLSFASHIITDALGAMRYDWDGEQNRFSFYLDPAVPYIVGANAEHVVDRLLSGVGLRRSDIQHWVVHSGGKKVIDAICVNLGLTRHDVRHTRSVLRDHGNLSSGSFLFSYQRLVREQSPVPGEFGVLMTMGPGSTIETALVQW